MTNRSSSLIIVDDDAFNDSQSTEEPPSPIPALVQLQQQVTSESRGTGVSQQIDIPVSPSSSSISNVSSQVRCSILLDSATVTATDMSAESLSSLPSQSASLPQPELPLQVQPDQLQHLTSSVV